MKKLIFLLTLLFIASLCLFACGNPEEESSSSSESESQSESQSSSQTEWNDPDWTPPIK